MSLWGCLRRKHRHIFRRELSSGSFFSAVIRVIRLLVKNRDQFTIVSLPGMAPAFHLASALRDGRAGSCLLHPTRDRHFDGG